MKTNTAANYRPYTIRYVENGVECVWTTFASRSAATRELKEAIELGMVPADAEVVFSGRYSTRPTIDAEVAACDSVETLNTAIRYARKRAAQGNATSRKNSRIYETAAVRRINELQAD